MREKEILHLNGEQFIKEELGIYTHLSGPEKLHDHDFYEFFYVTSGEYLHEYNGGERERLTSGSFVLVKPGDAHKTVVVKAGTMRDVLVNTNTFEKLRALLPNEAQYALDQCGKVLQIDLEKLEEIDREVSEFLSENDLPAKRCLGIRMVVKLLSCFLPLANANDLPPVVKRAVNSININFRRKDCVKRLPTITNYSSTYLYRLFKEHMHCTPGEYLISTRLSYVEYYLKNTSYTLEQIAELVGIESTSYLIRVFKKKNGISPIAYRKKHYKNQ